MFYIFYLNLPSCILFSAALRFGDHGDDGDGVGDDNNDDGQGGDLSVEVKLEIRSEFWELLGNLLGTKQNPF